jgi:hypothetical protein
MTTVWDTAGAIRVIDALSVEECQLSCWCRNDYSAMAAQHSRYTWKPDDTIVRFPLGEEAA